MDERAWERIKQVFHEALARPAAERRAFVQRACGGDATLCAEVEELLASHEEAGEREPASAPLGEAAGTLIGPYKLLQRIGEGGFGIVYMAEQTMPVRRVVALKIIKLGMDTKQVIARFEAERQALALMDHPNIARVLDAGATATGRPYFVMELVKGVPITEYCDANNLTTRARLELFVAVCHAVRHAHQKGVIHRDIKPSNVLVTLHDGVPVPKVIDFGIAKATGARLTDKTLFTEFKQLMGTPEYMSPEQAEMSGLDVDTRADIYSLGVLLYELLTGTTPFDAKTLRQAAYDEILRIIREVEPQKPSTRVSTLGERLAEIAKHRRAEPGVLSRLLLGDLDWIVMKALEKDRTRRYESADGFAQDIERHLRDEPVLASPPSSAYKLRKFARRNRLVLGAFAGITAALVLGLAAATWGWLRARSDRDRALAAERVASRETERVEKVNSILRRFLHAPSGSSLAKGSAAAFGPDVKVVDVVDEVVKSLEKEFAGEPEIEAEVRLEIAESYRDLSRFVDAESQVRRALELRRQISGGEDLPTMRGLEILGDALNWQGRYDEAEDCLRREIEGCRRLVGERAVETLRAQSNLVMFLMDKDEPEAEPLARQVVELCREIRGADHPHTLMSQAALAFVLNTAGKAAEGEALALDTLAAMERTGADMGSIRFCLVVLGNSAMELGRPVEAEGRFREVLELAERTGEKDLFGGAIAAGQLALAVGAQGRWAEAERLSRHVGAASMRLFGGAHPYTFEAYSYLARSLAEQGKGDEAEATYRELVELCERSFDPRRPDLRPDATRLLVRHLRRTGKLAEAESVARAGIEGPRERWLAKPDDKWSADPLIRAFASWGETLADLDRDEEAKQAFREALEICEESLIGEDSDTLVMLERLAVQLDEQVMFGEAEGLCRRILELRRRTRGDQEPATLLAMNNLAWVLHRVGRDAEAEPLARASVEGQRRLRATPRTMATVLDTLACVWKELGRAEEAEALFVEAEDFAQRVPDARFSSEIMLHHAECLIALDRLEEAEQHLLAAHDLLPASDTSVRAVSRAVVERLAELYAAMGKEEQANEWLGKSAGK